MYSLSVRDGSEGEQNADEYFVSSGFQFQDLYPEENCPNCGRRQNQREQRFDQSEWQADRGSQQKDYEQRVGKALFVNRIRGPAAVNRTPVIASLNFPGDLLGVGIAAMEQQFSRAQPVRE